MFKWGLDILIIFNISPENGEEELYQDLTPKKGRVLVKILTFGRWRPRQNFKVQPARYLTPRM